MTKLVIVGFEVIKINVHDRKPFADAPSIR